MAFLDRPDDPDVRAFVEAGGYGKFGSWVDGGFTTTDTGGPRRPGGGLYFKDGEYLTVEGTDHRRVPPGYQVIGQDDPFDESGNVGETTARDPGRLIAKRISTSPAPASSAPESPAEPIDADAISRAKDLAAAAKSKYAGSIPTLDTTRPLQGSADFGRGMQANNQDYQDWRNSESNRQTTEIREAGKSALGRFFGTVADIKVPDWKAYKA